MDYKLQEFIFENKITRLGLAKYNSESNFSTYKIMVYRNHSFELIENSIKCFSDYAEMNLAFTYSSYDDSLSFNEVNLDVDLVVIWLDLGRYGTDNLKGFIEGRIKRAGEIYNTNILVILDRDIENLNLNGAFIYPIDDIIAELKDDFYDERLEKISGTRLSSTTMLALSKDLGLQWFPALLKPALKCIVVDLDNTLYNGVLGEDGVEGIHMSPHHRQLQERLKELSQGGFFVCVVSKNDQDDVINLFMKRTDFPLKLEDITSIKANWHSKARSIKEIATELNINTDSFLFIDDNQGELTSVKLEHPEIKTIWARDHAKITLDVLRNFPGLLKLNFTLEDRLRQRDVVANAERNKLQSSMSIEDYIKSMEMRLDYCINEFHNITRISELANKTNQFIFSYKRYTENEIRKLMDSSESVVVDVSFSDKLSDSGIICAIVIKQVKNVAVLDDCFVSCRALGRGIDKLIVLKGIAIALEYLGMDLLYVEYKSGDRNTPAINFIQDHLARFVNEPMRFRFSNKEELVKITIKREQK